MLDQRRKGLWYAAMSIVVVWLIAWGGFALARSSKMTAEKVRNYLRSVDLARLSPADRAKALRELERRLNALSYEERRAARLDREWSKWFEVMSETEKGEFIEATLPTGFRQMLNGFEQLPELRRKKTIDDALKRLKEAREELAANSEDIMSTNAPVLSEELRQKVTTIGLKAFYSQSSAQTKAEAAPLLEELQRMMETGAWMRGR